MTRKTHPSTNNNRKPRFRKPGGFKKKVCRFCADKIDDIDFKNVQLIQNFLTERGKIIAARVTGVCAKHQRLLTMAIKRARDIALLPYSAQ
jgi:small subunit ribosomal protein S18